MIISIVQRRKLSSRTEIPRPEAIGVRVRCGHGRPESRALTLHPAAWAVGCQMTISQPQHGLAGSGFWCDPTQDPGEAHPLYPI